MLGAERIIPKLHEKIQQTEPMRKHPCQASQTYVTTTGEAESTVVKLTKCTG